MKKIITAAALIFVSAIGFSQDNYTVKMSMKIDGLPPEYAAAGKQETVSYTKGDKTKTEVTGMMGSQIVLFDGKKQTVLIEQMGNKMGYTATKEEMEAMNDKSESKPKVEYTTEKKTIAGYECTKAIVTSVDKDKKENKVIVWVTDKIKSESHKTKGGRGMVNFGDLKGYPLEMEMKNMAQGTELKITITATGVSTAPIADSVFVVDTEGYKLMTYKEFKAMSQSMGGR